VNLSVIKLRKIAPHLKRPFKAPLYPLTPIAGIVASAFLALFIEPSVLVLGFELVIVALLVYYIKMVGHHRIRVAFGGISLGLGGFTAYVAYLIGTNVIVLNGVSQAVASMVTYFLIFVSIIQVLAGILGVTAAER